MEHFAALGRLTKVLNRDIDLLTAMRAALDAVLEIVQFDCGGIYVIDHTAKSAHVRCAVGLPEDFLSELAVIDLETPTYHRVLVEGESIYAEDYATLSPERAARWGFASLASIPLPFGDTIFGALNVVSRTHHKIPPFHRQVLEMLGQELGTAFSRTRIVAELRQTQDNLRAFFELSPDMLFVLDGDGAVVEMNAEARRQLGYTMDEIRGRSVMELHPADQLERVATTITRMLSGLSETCGVPLLTHSGHEVPVETRVAQGTWNGADALFGVSRSSRSDRVLHAAVDALNRTLELRDPYTAGHVQGVSLVSVALAQEIGLEPDRIDLVRIAAELHDIGKVAVPSFVLAKPGLLTEGERMVVQEHSAHGYELLQPMDFLGPIPTIVRQHHERMDGSGYPDGLAGDDIMVEARIIAVADTVEAMSSPRPYHPPRPFGDVLAEIKRGAGTAYDPDVAAALQSLWRKNMIPLDAARAAWRHRRRRAEAS